MHTELRIDWILIKRNGFQLVSLTDIFKPYKTHIKVILFSIMSSYQRSFDYNTRRPVRYMYIKLKFKARDNNFVHFCFTSELSGNSFGEIVKSDRRVCQHNLVEFPWRVVWLSCVACNDHWGVFESANASIILYMYRLLYSVRSMHNHIFGGNHPFFINLWYSSNA